MPLGGFKLIPGFRKSCKKEGTPLHRRLQIFVTALSLSSGRMVSSLDNDSADGPSQWEFSSILFLQFWASDGPYPVHTLALGGQNRA